MSSVHRARSIGLPWRAIGEGSNILAPDAGVGCAIIVFRDDRAPQAGPDGLVCVSGGFPLTSLVAFLCERGLAGLEMLAGIPGTVGGAIAGNAGAYGRSIGESLKSVTLLGRDGKIREAGRDELSFGYRHSALKESFEVVLEVLIQTTPGKAAPLIQTMNEKIADRASKHPDYRKIPTAGSWFKNIRAKDGTMTPAGKLIDETGCKDLRFGGAFLWEKHANIVVTDGSATSADIDRLTSEIAGRVFDRFGIELVEEVCRLR